MPNVRSTYTDEIQFFGSHSPRELAARFGTPLYVYNENMLRRRCRDLLDLSDYPGFRVNYSAKANTNPALLKIAREEGCRIDAMSPGELYLNELAGFTPEEMLYVCNNVSAEEMKNAVDHGLLLSVDSLSQLDTYGRVNPGGKVMVRFNPGVGAGHSAKVVTGGKETKFGVDPATMPDVRNILERHKLTLAGVNQHIGSLFMDGADYLAAMEVLLALAADLLRDGYPLEMIDFGGGFGIPYEKYANQPRFDLASFGKKFDARLKEWSAAQGYHGLFLVEPGRYIMAECGLVLGTVHAVKNNGANIYVGTDIGFPVMMRAAMYDAFHDIEIYRENGAPDGNLLEQTVVGNICESGDILAKKRLLPRIQESDILAVLDAGAYGYVMASTYNQRLRPAEVLIGPGDEGDGSVRLIRRRETPEDLTRTLA